MSATLLEWAAYTKYKSVRRVNTLQSRLAQSRLIRVATSRRTQSRIQRQATNILLNLQYKVSLQPFPTAIFGMHATTVTYLLSIRSLPTTARLDDASCATAIRAASAFARATDLQGKDLQMGDETVTHRHAERTAELASAASDDHGVILRYLRRSDKQNKTGPSVLCGIRFRTCMRKGIDGAYRRPEPFQRNSRLFLHAEHIPSHILFTKAEQPRASSKCGVCCWDFTPVALLCQTEQRAHSQVEFCSVSDIFTCLGVMPSGSSSDKGRGAFKSSPCNLP